MTNTYQGKHRLILIHLLSETTTSPMMTALQGIRLNCTLRPAHYDGAPPLVQAHCSSVAAGVVGVVAVV